VHHAYLRAPKGELHYSVKDWDLKPRKVSDEINSIRVEEGIQR
jgi:hypothetical protein